MVSCPGQPIPRFYGAECVKLTHGSPKNEWQIRARVILKGVQAAFGPVLFIVCGVSIVGAFLALASSGAVWKEFGTKRLVLDRDLPVGPAPGSTAALLERDAEIHQLLEARNARRLRRGEQPIDVEQEFARLTAPQVDGALRGEIRDLVIARNLRRARKGQPPLDVEAEIEREIAGLSDLL